MECASYKASRSRHIMILPWLMGIQTVCLAHQKSYIQSGGHDAASIIKESFKRTAVRHTSKSGPHRQNALQRAVLIRPKLVFWGRRKLTRRCSQQPDSPVMENRKVWACGHEVIQLMHRQRRTSVSNGITQLMLTKGQLPDTERRTVGAIRARSRHVGRRATALKNCSKAGDARIFSPFKPQQVI